MTAGGEALRFAQLLILTDPTEGDIAVYGVAVPHLPPTLLPLAISTGPAKPCRAHSRSAPATDCTASSTVATGFTVGVDLLELRGRQVDPAASYVNTIDRTVRQLGHNQLDRLAKPGRCYWPDRRKKGRYRRFLDI
jgi:hypothetical protein